MSALPLKMEGNQPRTWNAQRLRCARFCLCGVKSRTTALPAKFAPQEVVINKANEAGVRLNLCAQKNQCKKLWNLISHVHSAVNRVAQSSHGDFIWLHCAAASLNQKVTNGLTSVGGCRLFSEFALTEKSVRLLPACLPALPLRLLFVFQDPELLNQISGRTKYTAFPPPTRVGFFFFPGWVLRQTPYGANKTRGAWGGGGGGSMQHFLSVYLQIQH